MKSILHITATIPLTAGLSLVGATGAQASSPKWLSISAGATHTCAISWGKQLGDGTTNNRGTPKKVGTSTSWTAVSGGGYDTCAVHTSGLAYCWGYNAQGQLGVGDGISRHSPTRVS